METLCDDPLIYTKHEFLSNDECKHFIDISRRYMKQSLVSGDKEGYISSGRTGKNHWIKHNHDDITLNVAMKIATEVGLPLENAESFQVIYYDKLQEYKSHYDGWLFDNSEKSRRNMKYGGQRMKTALIYLNDVDSGGGTRFTRLNIDVSPKQGKLLIFENVHAGTNKRHILSEHAGQPVTEGEKWAFNLWFREESRKSIYNYNKNTLNH